MAKDKKQELLDLISTLELLKDTSEEAAQVYDELLGSAGAEFSGGFAEYLQEVLKDGKAVSMLVHQIRDEIDLLDNNKLKTVRGGVVVTGGDSKNAGFSTTRAQSMQRKTELTQEITAIRSVLQSGTRLGVGEDGGDVFDLVAKMEELQEELASLTEILDDDVTTLSEKVSRGLQVVRSVRKNKPQSGRGARNLTKEELRQAADAYALTTPEPVGRSKPADKITIKNNEPRVSKPAGDAPVNIIVSYLDKSGFFDNSDDYSDEMQETVKELKKVVDDYKDPAQKAKKPQISRQIKTLFRKVTSASSTFSPTQVTNIQEDILKPVIEALKGVGADDEILQAGATRGASADAIKSAVQRVVSMLVTEQSGKAVRVGESVVDNDMLQILKPGALDRVIRNLGGIVRRSAVKTVVPRGQTASLHLLNVMEDALGDTGALTVESKRDNDIPSSSDALSNTRVFPQFITKLGAYFSKFRQSMRASLNPSLRYGPEAQGVDTRTGSQIVAGSSSAVFGGGMDAAVQQAVDRLLAQVSEDISKGSMATARIAGSDVQLPQTLAKMVVEAIQTSSVLSEHTTAMGRMAGDKGPRGALETGDPVRKLIALFAGDLINQYRSTGGVSADAAQNFMDQTVTPPQEHEVTLALTHAMRLRERLTFQRDRADLDMVTASPQVAGAYRRDSIQLTKQIQLLDELLKVSDDPEEEKKLALRRGQIALPMNEEQAALTRDQALTVLLRMPIGSVPAMPDAVAPIVQKAQQVSSGLRESGLAVPVRPSYGTSPVQSLVDFFSAGQTQSLEKFQPIPLTKQLDEVSAPTSGLEQKDIVAIISDAFGLSRQSGSQGNAITGIFYGARATDNTGRIKTGDDLDQALGGGYRTKNGLRSIVQASAEMQSYGSSGIPLIDYARLATATGRTEEEESMFEQVKAKLPHLGSIGEDQLKELAALDTSMDPQALIKRVMTLAAPAIQAHLTAFIKKQAKTAGMTPEQTQQLIDSGSAGENVPAGFESAFRVLQMFDPKNINSNDVTSEVNRAFSLFSTMLTDVVQPNESMPQLAARLLGRENRLEGAGAPVAEALPDKNASFALLRAGGEVADTEGHRVTGSVYSRSVANQNNLTEALKEFEKLKAEIAELQSDISLKPEEADKITPIINQKIDQLQQVREKLRLYYAAEPDTISMKFEALSTIVQSDTAGDTEKANAVRDLALMQTIFKHTGRYVIDESQGFGSGTQEQRLAALLEHNEKEERLANLKKVKTFVDSGGDREQAMAMLKSINEQNQNSSSNKSKKSTSDNVITRVESDEELDEEIEALENRINYRREPTTTYDNYRRDRLKSFYLDKIRERNALRAQADGVTFEEPDDPEYIEKQSEFSMLSPEEQQAYSDIMGNYKEIRTNGSRVGGAVERIARAEKEFPRAAALANGGVGTHLDPEGEVDREIRGLSRDIEDLQTSDSEKNIAFRAEQKKRYLEDIRAGAKYNQLADRSGFSDEENADFLVEAYWGPAKSPETLEEKKQRLLELEEKKQELENAKKKRAAILLRKTSDSRIDLVESRTEFSDEENANFLTERELGPPSPPETQEERKERLSTLVRDQQKLEDLKKKRAAPRTISREVLQRDRDLADEEDEKAWIELMDQVTHFVPEFAKQKEEFDSMDSSDPNFADAKTSFYENLDAAVESSTSPYLKMLHRRRQETKGAWQKAEDALVEYDTASKKPDTDGEIAAVTKDISDMKSESGSAGVQTFVPDYNKGKSYINADMTIGAFAAKNPEGQTSQDSMAIVNDMTTDTLTAAISDGVSQAHAPEIVSGILTKAATTLPENTDFTLENIIAHANALPITDIEEQVRKTYDETGQSESQVRLAQDLNGMSQKLAEAALQQAKEKADKEGREATVKDYYAAVSKIQQEAAGSDEEFKKYFLAEGSFGLNLKTRRERLASGTQSSSNATLSAYRRMRNPYTGRYHHKVVRLGDSPIISPSLGLLPRDTVIEGEPSQTVTGAEGISVNNKPNNPLFEQGYVTEEPVGIVLASDAFQDAASTDILTDPANLHRGIVNQDLLGRIEENPAEFSKKDDRSLIVIGSKAEGPSLTVPDAPPMPITVSREEAEKQYQIEYDKLQAEFNNAVVNADAAQRDTGGGEKGRTANEVIRLGHQFTKFEAEKEKIVKKIMYTPAASTAETSTPETIDEQIARVQGEIAALETPATKLAREAAERGIKGQGEVAGRTYVHPDVSHGEPLTYVSRRSTLPLTADYPRQLSERFAKTGRIDISPEVAGSEAATIVNAAVAETLGLPIGPEVMPTVSEITPTNVPDTSTSNQSSAGAVPYFFVPGQSEPMVVVGQSTGAFKGRGVAAPVMGTVDEGQTQWQAAEREAQEELGVVFDPKADVPATVVPSTNDAFYMRRVQSISPASAHFETQGVQIVPLSVAISQLESGRAGDQRDMQAGREALIALQTLIEEGVIVNDKEDVPIVDEDTAKMIELTAKLKKLQAEKEAMTTGQNPDDIVNEAISEAERRITELSTEAEQVSRLGSLQKVVSRAKTDQVNRAKSPPLRKFYGHVDTPTLRETAAPKGIPFEESERIFEELKQAHLTNAPVADDYKKIDQQIEDLNLELVDEDSKKREREAQQKKLRTQSEREWNPTQKHQSALMTGVMELGFDFETGSIKEGSFFSEFSSPDLVFESLKALAPTNKKGEIDVPWFIEALKRLQTDSELQQQVKSTAEVLGVEPEPSEKAKQRSELQARRQIMSMFEEGVQTDESTTVGYRETVREIAKAREAEKQIKEIEKENESIIAARSIYDEAEQQTALELESLGIVPDDTSSNAVITAASAEISKLVLGGAEKRQTPEILNVEQIQQLRKEAIHQLPNETLLDAHLPGQSVSLRERIDFEAARVAQGMTGAPTVVPTLEGLLQNPDELLLDADGKPIIMYRGEDADQIAARLGEDPLVYAKDTQQYNLQSEIVFPVETPMAPGGASVYGQGFYHGVTQSEDVEGGHSAEEAKKVAVGYASGRGNRSFVHAAALKSTARLLNITPELVQEAEKEVNQRREKHGLQPRKPEETEQKSHITDTVEMLYRQTVDPNFRSKTDIDNEAQALLRLHGNAGNILSAEVDLRAAGIPEEVVQQVMKLKEEHAVTPSMEALAVGMGYDALRFRTGVNDSRSASFLTLFNPGQSVVVSTPEYASRPEDQTGSTTRELTQITETERRYAELQKQLEEQKQQLAALKARSEALKQEAATAPTPTADVTAVVEESKRVADETAKVSVEIKASTEEIQQREIDLDTQIAAAEKAVQRSRQQIAALQQQAEGGMGGDEEVYFTVDNTGGSVTLEEKQILDRTSLRPSVRTRMTAPDTGESLFVSNTNVPALVRAAQSVDPTTVDSVLASMTDEEMRRTGMPAAKLPEEFNWDQPSTLPKEWQKKSGEPLTDEERAKLPKTPAEFDAELVKQAAEARDTIQSNYYQEEYTADDPKRQSEINVAAETKRKSTATIAKFLETATRKQKQEYYRYMRAFDAETKTEEAVLSFPKDGDPAELQELQKKAEEARATRLALDESLKGTPVFAAADAEIDRYNADLVLQDATRNSEYDNPLNQAVREYYTTPSPDVKDSLLKSTPGLADRIRKITEAEESMTAADKQRAALWLPARVAAEKDATPEQLVSRLFREAEKAVREYADEFTTVPEFTARDVVDQLVSSAAAQTSTEAPATSPAVARAVGETLTDIGEKGMPPLEGPGGTMSAKKKKSSPAATVAAVEQKYSAGRLKGARKTVRKLSGRPDLTPEQRRRLSAARQILHANAIQKLTTKFGDNKGVMQIANIVAGLTPPDWAADPVQSARVSAISEAMSGLSPFALRKLRDVDLTNSVDLDRLSKDEELRPIMEMLASQDIQQALSFKSGTQAYDTASGVIKAVETAKESLVEDSRGSADAEEKKKLFFDLETTMGSKSSERKIYQAASGSEGGDVEELFAVPVPSSAAAIQAVAADTTLTEDEKRKQIRELALKRVGKKPYVEGTDVNPKVIDRLVDHAMRGGTIHTQAGIKEILKGQIKESAGVVGHNIADFDLPIVYDDAVPKYVKAKTEDTLLMSREAYPGAHSLSDTYMAVTGNPLVDAHDAAVDTRAVQEVYPSLATDEERRKLRARYLASRGIAPDSTVARLADIPQLDSIADDAERQKAFQQTAAAYTYYRPLAEMQDFTQNVVRSGGVTRIQGATDEQQATVFENMNKMFGTEIKARFGDGQTIETLDDKQLGEFIGYIDDKYIKPNQSNAVDGDYGGMAQMLANKMGGPLTLRGFNRSNLADDFEKYATLEDRLAEGAMTGLSHDPTMTRATVEEAVSDLSAGKPTTVSTTPSSSTKPASPTTTGGTTAGGGVRPPGGGSGLTTAASPDGSGGGGGSGFSSIGQATIDSLHAQNVAIEINGGTVNIHANFTDSAASKMTKSLVYISNKDGMNVNGDVTGIGGGGGGGGYRRVSPADRATLNVLEATKNEISGKLQTEDDPLIREGLRANLNSASREAIRAIVEPKTSTLLDPGRVLPFARMTPDSKESLVLYNQAAQTAQQELTAQLATQQAIPEGTAGRDDEIERLQKEIVAVEELIAALTELNAVEQRVGSASGTRNINNSYGASSGTGTGGAAGKYYSRKSKEDEQVLLQLARNSFDQSGGSMGISGGSTTNDARQFLVDQTRKTSTAMIKSSGIDASQTVADIAAVAGADPEVQDTYDDAAKRLKDLSTKVGGSVDELADDLYQVASALEALKSKLTPLAATSPEAAASLAVVQTALDEVGAAGKEQRSSAGVIEADNRKKLFAVEEQMQAAASRPGFFAGGRRTREVRELAEGYLQDTFGQKGREMLMNRGRIQAYTTSGKRIDMDRATVADQRETVRRLQAQGVNVTAEDMTNIARLSGRVTQTQRSAPMGDKLFYAASKIRDVGTVAQTVIDTVTNIPNIPTMAANLLQQFASSATGSNRVMTTARGLALNPENYQAALGAADLQRKQFGGSLTSNLSQVSSFIPLSNAYGVDIGKTVKVARKLAAFDPAQGMEGASIAIKEFLSGNVSSLSRRFEINRSALSKINTGDADQMLTSLDQVLSGMGVTDRLIDEQAAAMATKYDKMVGNLESVQIGLSTAMVDFVTPTLESLLGDQSYFGKNVRERSLDTAAKEAITSYGDDALSDKDTGLGSVKLFGSTDLFSSTMDKTLENANRRMMAEAARYNEATGVSTKIAPYRLVGNMKPEERSRLQSAAIDNMLGGMSQTQAIMQAMRDNQQADYNISPETGLQRQSLNGVMTQAELRKANPVEYAKRVADKQAELETYKAQASQGMFRDFYKVTGRGRGGSGKATENPYLNKGNIERQVDIDTYDVRLAQSGKVVRVRLPGIDASESKTTNDYEGRGVAMDVLGMKRSDIGRTVNNSGAKKEGAEVTLVGNLKNVDKAGRALASVLTKDGKNLSVELVAAGEAAVSFADSLDESTTYALKMAEKLSGDLGLGSLNKDAFQVGMGGAPVISDEVRSKYFWDKYGMGIKGASIGGGAAGYGALAGVGALGLGGSAAALTAQVGLLGIGGAALGGAALLGGGYLGYAAMADSADQSPEKMRELLKMQAAQNKIDRESRGFVEIARAANKAVGGKQSGGYVGGITEDYYRSRVAAGLGRGAARPDYSTLEFNPLVQTETQKKIEQTQQKKEQKIAEAAKFGGTVDTAQYDEEIKRLQTTGFKEEQMKIDASNRVLDAGIEAYRPDYAKAYENASTDAQEKYASSSDYMKRVLSRGVVNPLTNTFQSYGDFSTQATALNVTAEETGDSTLLGFADITRTAQNRLKGGTVGFQMNEKTLAAAEKFGVTVDARQLAEVRAQPLKDEKADLVEKRNKAIEAGAQFEVGKITEEINAKQAEIDRVTFDDAEWSRLSEAQKKVAVSIDEFANDGIEVLNFAAQSAAQQMLNPQDYKREAKTFTDNSMDRNFQRRQQRVDSTLTAFARQSIMGLGKTARPDEKLALGDSRSGIITQIDNSPEARAIRMLQTSGLMPKNRISGGDIVNELTTAQRAAVAEQQSIASTNRQIGLANAPEMQLLKSGFTNFAMYMNMAGATAEDLGRSFMTTMNLLSEGNPRYGLDLAQQMTGLSYETMIGMQLRPRTGVDTQGNPISSLNGANGMPYGYNAKPGEIVSGPMVMPYTSGPRGTIAYSRDMMAVNANGVRENALGIAPSQWQQFVSNATNANAELQRRAMSNAIQERDLNKNHLRNLEDITRNGMRQLESIHLNYTRNMFQLTQQADLVKNMNRANMQRSVATADISEADRTQINKNIWARDMRAQHYGQGRADLFLQSPDLATLTAIDPTLETDIAALQTASTAYDENADYYNPEATQALQNEKLTKMTPVLEKLKTAYANEKDPLKKAVIEKAIMTLSPDPNATVELQNANVQETQFELGDAVARQQLGTQISDMEWQKSYRGLDIANNQQSMEEASKSKDPLALLNAGRNTDAMGRGFAQADRQLKAAQTNFNGLAATAPMLSTAYGQTFKNIDQNGTTAFQNILNGVDDFSISFQQQMEDALRNFDRQRLDMIQAFADAAVEIASIVPKEMIPIMQATSAFMNTQRQAELLWLSGRTDEANALAYQGMLKLGEVVYGEGKGKAYADKYSQNFEDMADVAARDVPQGDLGKFGVNTEDGWALRVKFTTAKEKKPEDKTSGPGNRPGSGGGPFDNKGGGNPIPA